MHNFQQLLKFVNDAIAKIDLPSSPKNLYEPIRYTMDLGGKRLRPVLMMMCCEAYGRKYTTVLNQAIGLEMFHNFTLLHDDVMDNADVRRGKPTVHRKWDANTAILSGDAMLTIATQYMANVASSKLAKVIEIFNTTALEIYEGQQLDMDFEQRYNVQVSEYIEMIRLKTSVLFGTACKMGAMLAGARESEQTLLYDFGVALGLAFQLQDDYLDTFGDEKTFGKEIGGDIMNSKKTFLLINALHKANDKQGEKLKELIAITDNERRKEKVDGVIAIYNELGIGELCTEEINKYLELALRKINESMMSDERKDYFTQFVKMLIGRNK